MPSSHYAMGSPSESATATATGTVTGSTATRSLWPTRRFRRGSQQQQSVRGNVHRLQLVAFSAVGTGHSPGSSASTHHDPFELLPDERLPYHLYGQINTINTLGPAAARTRPTLLVKLGRIHIEAVVDTGASATVINETTFAQVPDKDKTRLDTYVNQLPALKSLRRACSLQVSPSTVATVSDVFAPSLWLLS